MRRPSAVLALSLLCGACGHGSASVEGDIGGYTFDFQTVYVWINAKTLAPDPSGKVVVTDTDRKTATLELSGAAFSPERDPRFLSRAELDEIADEEGVNGRMTLQIANFEKAAAKSVATADAAADTPTLAAASWAFGLKELDADSDYPASFPRYGSTQKVKVTFDEVGKEPGDDVAGTIELTIDKAEGDGAEVKTGKVAITFSAPVVKQWIALCHEAPGNCNPDKP